jgi:hypothetical protein
MWGLYSRLCSALPSRPHSQRRARDSRRESRRQWHSDLIDSSKVVCEPLLHAAVNALGYLLPLSVSPSSEDERAQVQPLTPQVQAVTGEHVEIAYVDQGYTGPDAATSAAQHGIALVLTKTPQPSAALSCCPSGGWWKAPSHTTHKALLTSIGVPPIIGLTGLLNLLRVGTRLQAARDLGFQEGGAPCPSSRLPTQPTQPLSPPTCLPRAVRAVPPAHEWGPVHALGSPASGQSPAAALPAGSPHRASTDPDDGQPVRRRRGGTS